MEADDEQLVGDHDEAVTQHSARVEGQKKAKAASLVLSGMIGCVVASLGIFFGCQYNCMFHH